MIETLIYETIAFFIFMFIIAFIKYKFFSKKKDNDYNEYEEYIPGIKNLFCEMKSQYVSYEDGTYYTGYIKTIFPNGKERVVWKSQTHRFSNTTEKEMKIRFKFLCKFYGLNENGEASDFRLNFDRNFNDNKK